MTDFARYRAVSALSSLEGLAHALRISLAEGRETGAAEALASMAHDLEEARKAVTPAPTEEEIKAKGWRRPTKEEMARIRMGYFPGMLPHRVQWVKDTPGGSLAVADESPPGGCASFIWKNGRGATLSGSVGPGGELANFQSPEGLTMTPITIRDPEAGP